MATVSFVQQPYNYNPVNNPIWVVNYSYNYADPEFKYIFNIYKGTQSFLGQYKVAPRPNGYCNFDIHKVIKANLDINYSPSIGDIMTGVNLLIAAPTTSTIQFSYTYGYESYIGLTFASTFPYTPPGTSSVFVGLSGFSGGWTSSLQPNDIINIQMNPLSINYNYNGESVIMGSVSNTSVYTNIGMGFTESLPYAGVIGILQRELGTSSTFWGINGTRQYYDDQINNSGYLTGYYDIYADKSLVLPYCTTSTTTTTTTSGITTTSTSTTTTTGGGSTTTSTTTTTTTGSPVSLMAAFNNDPGTICGVSPITVYVSASDWAAIVAAGYVFPIGTVLWGDAGFTYHPGSGIFGLVYYNWTSHYNPSTGVVGNSSGITQC